MKQKTQRGGFVSPIFGLTDKGAQTRKRWRIIAGLGGYLTLSGLTMLLWTRKDHHQGRQDLEG